MTESPVKLILIRSYSALPLGLTRDALADAFFLEMAPYNDTKEEILRALDKGLSSKEGGYLIAALKGDELVGGLLMLETGMSGYIPPYLLLMVYVTPSGRGMGLGKRIIEKALSYADGDVKLHVEHGNPAQRLYERMGFKSKYLDMRLTNS